MNELVELSERRMSAIENATPKQIDRALLELSLRLAWYINKYGPIPDTEMFKMTVAGHGIGTPDECSELLVDSAAIATYAIEELSR